MYVYHIFIYSSIDGHLGCFHILSIVYNAAVNLGCTCIFELAFLFPLAKYLGVELLDHMVVLYLVF